MCYVWCVAGVRVHVLLSRELLARVDAAREGELQQSGASLGRLAVSRGEWVRGAVERALATDLPSVSAPSEQLSGPGSLGDGAVSEPVAGAPRPVAAQPDLMVRLEESLLLRCRVPGCEFAAPSAKATCPVHGGRVR